MNGRQIIILLVGAACLVFAGVRFAGLFGNKRPNYGLPPELRRTWQCRTDGHVTNLTPAEVDAQFAAGQIGLDPKNLAVQLYRCPQCGKQTLEQVVIRMDAGAGK